MKLVIGLAVWAALSCAGVAFAQEAPATAAAEESVPADATPMAADVVPASELVHAGYAVDIALAETVSSSTHKRGDKFAIQLVYPIYTDAGVLVPAGTRGVGEVISAALPGRMGKGGELLLAARYLDYEGQKIPLRGFKLGASGKNYTSTLFTAAFIAPLPGVILSFAVKGGDQTFPLGTWANAKLAADLTLPVIAPIPVSTTAGPQPGPASSDSAK